MKMPNLALHHRLAYLLLRSAPRIAFAVSTPDDFLQFLSPHSENTTAVSRLVDTPINSSYYSILSRLRRTLIRDPTWGFRASVSSKDFQTFFYNQTLDHFNYRPESYTSFRQKYLINYEYWGGAMASAPIFAYLGAEEPIGDNQADFLTDNAAKFRALLVYIEHRFYGESIPYGLTLDKALSDPNIRGYFNSAQALADFAEILVHLKQKLDAKHSPIIVFEASYGGTSWFRLKYSHVVLGALASSAPILYFYDVTPRDAYYSIVANVFLKTSFSCHQTIRRSWEIIDRVASEPHRLAKLSRTFKTCRALQSSSEVKDYLMSVYMSAAQHNDPFRRPVKEICNAIDGASPRMTFSRRFLQASSLPLEILHATSIHLLRLHLKLIWVGIGRHVARSCSLMASQIVLCFNPLLSTYMSTRMTAREDMALHLAHNGALLITVAMFASNIIFSNGLQDPYSGGGILKNISDTVVAVYTAEGSHCLDIEPATENDPIWLIKAAEN